MSPLTTPERTYVDANVLIAAFQGDTPSVAAALAILGDSGRVFVASDFVRLETLPKPSFHRNEAEVAFYAAFFQAVSEWVAADDALTRQAISLATRYDLTPVDALHVAAAVAARVDESVTLEKPTKPMLRVSELAVRSIYRQAG